MSSTDRDLNDLASRRASIDAADVFLTALSRGVDPSRGSDELASLLLGMRQEVENGLQPLSDLSTQASRASRRRSGIRRNRGNRSADVTHLASHRSKRDLRKRFVSIGSAAVGAVAASTLIIGAGSAIYHANPGESLWGAHVAIFGEPNTTLVQLASTFSEVDKLASKGDVEGAQRLIDEAREFIDYLDQHDQELAQRQLEVAQRSVDSDKQQVTTSTSTVTSTETTTVVETETSTLSPTATSTHGAPDEPVGVQGDGDLDRFAPKPHDLLQIPDGNNLLPDPSRVPLLKQDSPRRTSHPHHEPKDPNKDQATVGTDRSADSAPSEFTKPRSVNVEPESPLNTTANRGDA